MLIIEEEGESRSKWLLRRHGSFIQDIQIDLDDDEIVLGRGYTKDVKFGIGVSRRHALLKRVSNTEWKIKDLGSMNGLFINQTKVAENCFEHIKEFDIIGLGVTKAIHEGHFSFMLCRRPKLHLYEWELLASPSGAILVNSTDRNNNAGEQNHNFSGLDRNITVKADNEESSVENVGNTVQKPKEIDDEVCILLQVKGKHKLVDIIILSDDSDSEDQMVPTPRKRSRLRKRKPVVISEESSSTCDEIEDTAIRGGKLYSKANNAIIISDEEDFEECNQNELVNTRKESVDDFEEKSTIDNSVFRSEMSKSVIAKKHGDIDGVSSDDDMPLSDTVDDAFDYGDNIDCSIDEEQLLSRLVWPSLSDDWNKENVSDPQICKIGQHSGEIDTESNNGEAKVIISGKEGTPTAQIKPTKSESASHSVTENLQCHSHSNSDSLQVKMRKQVGCHVSFPDMDPVTWKDTSENFRNILSTNDQHGNSTSTSTIIKKCTNKLLMGDNNVHNSVISENSSSTQAIQRFQSRTDLLLQSMLQSDFSTCVRKTKKK